MLRAALIINISFMIEIVCNPRENLYRTAISIEESGCQEQIFEKLELHKKVLSGVKQQPWPLQRKIRLVRQAKSYVRRHEGVLQERLAHTRSTKDAIARISLFTTKVILEKLFLAISELAERYNSERNYVYDADEQKT